MTAGSVRIAVGMLASGEPVGVIPGDDGDDVVEEEEEEVELCDRELDGVEVVCGVDVVEGESVVSWLGVDVDDDDDEDVDVELVEGKKGITVSSMTDVELGDEAELDGEELLSSVAVVEIGWSDVKSDEPPLLEPGVDVADDSGGTKVITVAPRPEVASRASVDDAGVDKVVDDISGPNTIELENDSDEESEVEVDRGEVAVEASSPVDVTASGIEAVDCMSPDVVESTTVVEDSLRVVIETLLF